MHEVTVIEGHLGQAQQASALLLQPLAGLHDAQVLSVMVTSTQSPQLDHSKDIFCGNLQRHAIGNMQE